MLLKSFKRFLKMFFKPTADEKTPTDVLLDVKILTVRFQLHELFPEIEFIIKEKIRRFFRHRWKFISIKSIKVLAVAVLIYFAVIKVVEPVFVTEIVTQKEVVLQYPDDSSMTLENFLLQIQYSESRYNATANREGSQFWGLYQIGSLERKNAGYGDIDYNTFMNHPEIQHLCMINLLQNNKKYMQEYIDKYDGEIIDGILVTESGILALCQMGCSTAKKYLDNKKIPVSDENGNNPRLLLKLGGYKLDFSKYNFSKLDGTKLNY